MELIYYFLRYFLIEVTGYISEDSSRQIPIDGKILSPEDIGKSADSGIDWIFCATNYEDSGEHLKQWKYSGSDNSVEPLIESVKLSCEQYCELFTDIDYIIPFPIGIDRYFTRGFNQSYFLSKCISRSLQIPLFHGIFRIWSGKHQSRLSKLSRMNRKIHFISFFSGMLQGKNILLVDDVVSTGTSASLFAKHLLLAGVSSVSLFVLARNHIEVK